MMIDIFLDLEKDYMETFRIINSYAAFSYW